MFLGISRRNFFETQKVARSLGIFTLSTDLLPCPLVWNAENEGFPLDCLLSKRMRNTYILLLVVHVASLA